MRTIRTLCGTATLVAILAAPADALQTVPASGAQASDRLAASARQAEWVTIRVGEDSVRAWVVYPEHRENAPVVVAVHDNRGMSNWIRAVADQLAADGFIAIAPDMLSMLPVPRQPDGESDPDSVRAVIGRVDQATRDRYIQAFGEWGTRLPGASDRYGIVGFCWGGSTVFAHAVAAPPSLGAVVVYYGGSPAPEQLSSVRAPILGLYGEDDARVNATVPQGEGRARRRGSHVRDAHVCRRRPRLHALAGGAGRREPCGGRAGVAAHGRVVPAASGRRVVRHAAALTAASSADGIWPPSNAPRTPHVGRTERSF